MCLSSHDGIQPSDPDDNSKTNPWQSVAKVARSPGRHKAGPYETCHRVGDPLVVSRSPGPARGRSLRNWPTVGATLVVARELVRAQSSPASPGLIAVQQTGKGL